MHTRAYIYESYHGSDASRYIYFVTHDFLPVTKPQGATKARLAPKGGSLTGERVRACGCDRGGSSCRLAPPPGPSSGASRHRSMVEISPPRLFSRSERARGYPEVAPSAITLRDLSVVGVVRAGAQQRTLPRPPHPPRASSIDASHRAPLLSLSRARKSSTTRRFYERDRPSA